MQDKTSKAGLWGKLSQKFTTPVTKTPKEKIDASYFDQLEETLIMADMGASLAINLVQKLRNMKFAIDAPEQNIKQAIKKNLLEIMTPLHQDFQLPNKSNTPFIIMVSGVNGTGKTTSIGKLTHHLMQQGYKVALIAGDTFRAGATEQLRIWADRNDALFFPNDEIKANDPAALAYQTIEYCQNNLGKADIIIMDTSGRLHNHENLMQELNKITRVMQKLIPDAPHESLLVLDATTGQNALRQAEQFQKDAGITGIMVNKMDGTAKGGMIPSLMNQVKLPVYFLGMGEQIDDFLPFNPDDYLDALLNITEST